jgi:hypothetical protein
MKKRIKFNPNAPERGQVTTSMKEAPTPAPAMEDPDPWKHRSDNMRCRTCMWWLRKGTSVVGRCRKNAPTFDGFPVMFNIDWCGQHRLDETKI